MSSDMAIYLSKQLLWQAVLISSPLVLIALFCGLITSILQVVTQIQDSIISFVPKLVVVVLALLFCGSWMLHSLVDFTQNLIVNIPERLG